ncbi:helix-turn-helix domain-containing protein [Mesorhizobium sp. IMUNJ 23232]|uniref:helix-turn-helix domain-containing protein n=1 Tax=Mesorhizobium sp. IMUNJ 23232 TaxID=3376064 RepID=UPI0037A01EE9
MNAQSLATIVNDGPLVGFRISERWGLVAEIGYQAVPDVLILRQSELGLTSAELNVMLNLTAHWWRSQDFVFPGAATIARRMNVTQRTVQRIISSLARKGFIRKCRTAKGEIFFDLAPLKEKLIPLAEKSLREKRQMRLLREMG